jgi:hypothetical protein
MLKNVLIVVAVASLTTAAVLSAIALDILPVSSKAHICLDIN